MMRMRTETIAKTTRRRTETIDWTPNDYCDSSRTRNLSTKKHHWTRNDLGNDCAIEAVAFVQTHLQEEAAEVFDCIEEEEDRVNSDPEAAVDRTEGRTVAVVMNGDRLVVVEEEDGYYRCKVSVSVGHHRVVAYYRDDDDDGDDDDDDDDPHYDEDVDHPDDSSSASADLLDP